jgi:N-acetylglutamate synthase/N-acetylornithine aminotransferase
VVVVSKIVDMTDKKSNKSPKNVIKDASTGTIQSIANFGTSIVDILKNEGDRQKEQFNESMIIATDENEKQAIRSHDLKKAIIRAGTALGCVGLGCITIVYINKNS